MDDNGEADLKYQNVDMKHNMVYLFGKPLSTNIQNMLGDRDRFKDCTYDLPEEMRIDVDGVI